MSPDKRLLTLLYIGDHEFEAETCADIVLQLPKRIFKAKKLDEAYEFLTQQNHVQLIVSDYRLGAIDGRALLYFLEIEGRKTPVVFRCKEDTISIHKQVKQRRNVAAILRKDDYAG